MIKKIFYIYFLLFFAQTIIAQKELWSIKTVTYDYLVNENNFDGQIIKAPLVSNSTSYEVVHTFDPTGVLGKKPQGKLLQASNGKLYGVTSLDVSNPNAENSTATLFEYDLVLNKYTVLNNTFKYPRFGLIEFSPGVLMGFINEGRTIFKYNFNTNIFTVLATLPSYVNGWLIDKPIAICQLSKCSDGNLYFTTDKAQILNGGSFAGGIYKYNPITNSLTQVFYFGQDQTMYDPIFPTYNAPMVEGSPGVFYGVTSQGGIHRNLPNQYPYAVYGSGTLYEYNVVTNIMVKKFDFDYNGIGFNSKALVKASSTKLYGTLVSINDQSFPNNHGSIYEYDISSSALTVKHIANPFIGEDYFYNGNPLLGSDGNLYGTSAYGIYKYNFTTDVVTNKIAGFGGFFEINEPIEICRKPSYQEFIVNTFSPAAGTAFTYNINNTNATTYVWKKGTTILPTQTTGILNFPSVSINDTGVYTCTMTNECGITITANLNINVVNLAVDTVDDYKDLISLYPNPTKGLLNLKFPENRGLKGIKYKITNLLGQIVQENDIINNKTELKIDTTSFANGVYQLTLVTDKGNWNGKFVKE